MGCLEVQVERAENNAGNSPARIGLCFRLAQMSQRRSWHIGSRHDDTRAPTYARPARAAEVHALGARSLHPFLPPAHAPRFLLRGLLQLQPPRQQQRRVPRQPITRLRPMVAHPLLACDAAAVVGRAMSYSLSVTFPILSRP